MNQNDETTWWEDVIDEIISFLISIRELIREH